MYQKLLSIDQSWLKSWNNFADNSHFWQPILKFISEYLIYSLPVILLIVWFYSAKSKIVGLQALFAAGLAFALSNIIGRLINRQRPFELPNVHELIFHRPSYSFPSDHSAVLFAIAFSLYFSGYKKLFWIMLVLAIIISLSRIATGIHFPSDIIIGAVLGIVSSWIIWLLERPLTIVYNFLIAIARKMRLA